MKRTARGIALPMVILFNFLLTGSVAYGYETFENNCDRSGCHHQNESRPFNHGAHLNYATRGCRLCHSQDPHLGAHPVYTHRSDPALPAPSNFGCMGCHGRDYGVAYPGDGLPWSQGLGLKRKHINAGINSCLACHVTDLNPLPENILPPYYGRTAITQTDPCNTDGLEDFLPDGAPDGFGLDNDGDGLYDANDPDCAGSPCTATAGAQPLQAILCENTSITLTDDNSAATCPPGGNLEYTWWDGPANDPSSTVVGTGRSYDLPASLAPGIYDYDLQVCCDNDPACCDSLDTLIAVDLVAMPGVINQLKAVIDTDPDDVRFSWDPDGAAGLYRVYSVGVKTQIPPRGGNGAERCSTPDGITVNCSHPGAVPDPSAILYYQVVGVCEADTTAEGPN
ncbi:hypothetical protein ACFLU6_13395 [Acidobacteriota bacterium]